MTISPNSPVCPEKRLLALCARTRAARVAAQIEEMARRPLDWDVLLSEATENGITPLLDRQMQPLVPVVVAHTVGERLRAARRANTVRNLFLSAELGKVVRELESAGVQAVTYKGPALAVQAYGDVTLREFDDLDIVLPHRDLTKAHQVIGSLGYRAKFPWVLSPDAPASLVPGEYNYRDEARRIIVEIHTERTLRHVPLPPDLAGLYRRSVRLDVAGREVRTFSVEDNIPILCVHGSKDFWGRLGWIADIAEIVQAHEDLDWDAVVRCAETHRSQRMLHLGLALACDVLQLCVPQDVARRFRQDSVAAGIAEQVARALLGRGPSVPVGWGRFNFRRRMLPGFLAGSRYALRLALTPAEEDWSAIRLPPPLSPLYVVLRPLRLLRKYGFSSRGRQLPPKAPRHMSSESP